MIFAHDICIIPKFIVPLHSQNLAYTLAQPRLKPAPLAPSYAHQGLNGGATDQSRIIPIPIIYYVYYAVKLKFYL